jgi:predicted permease
VLERILQALRAVLFRRRLDREMREEMELHLARSTERLMARGMGAEEARAAARREFGNVDYHQERARDARGQRWAERTLADVRFGVRHLARTPITALTMVLLLALGIGVNSALFALLHSLATMPSPGVARDEALVRIRGIDRADGPGRVIGREVSYPEFREYAAESSVFDAVAAWTSADVVLGSGGGDDLTSGAATYVTGGYFEVLGVRPELGAALLADADDDGPPELAAVISHAVWDRHFGRTPEVVGRSLEVNDATVTVVGVAPRGFIGTRSGGSSMRVWLPLSARPVVQRTGARLLARWDSASFGLAARLAPGTGPGDALPAVERIAARAALETPMNARARGFSADVVTMTANNYFPPSGSRPSVAGRVSSLIIPFVVLLIPCTNVSALLVGLAAARRREIAVRLALGAARRRIVRQLITESVLLAVAAGALGLLVIRVLWALFGARLPDVQLALHWPAPLFTFAVATLTGVLFGITPALHATRVGVSEVLKDSAESVASGRSRLQSGLVVSQIALTQPLLVGLGAIVLGLSAELGSLPAPEHGDRIVHVTFSNSRTAGVEGRARDATIERVRARLAALPGVERVVARDERDGYVQVSVHPSDVVDGVQHPETFELRTSAAPEGFFPLMGYTFVRGGAVARGEGAGEGALVIPADVARRLWGDADPLGRRLVRAGGGASAAFVVVGVLDPSSTGATGDGEWRSFVLAPGRPWSLLVRTRAPAEPILPEIRAVANQEAPDLPVVRAATLASAHAAGLTQARRAIVGALGGGGVALLLSAIGLYTVVSFAVGQRAHEIGVRTALGADRGRIVRMFFRRGVRLGVAGLGIGLALSVVVLRLLTLAQGREMEPGIGRIAAITALVVVTVAAVATWIPARRAAAVDPTLVLRAE